MQLGQFIYNIKIWRNVHIKYKFRNFDWILALLLDHKVVRLINLENAFSLRAKMNTSKGIVFELNWVENIDRAFY